LKEGMKWGKLEAGKQRGWRRRDRKLDRRWDGVGKTGIPGKTGDWR
jgi:hypothetical protein